MIICRTCQSPVPDAEYNPKSGRICRPCRLKRSAADYRRQKAAALPRQRPPTLAQKICQLLTKDGPLTRYQIIQRLGVHRSQLNVALHTLREQQRLIITGDPPHYNNIPDPRLYAVATMDCPGTVHQVQHRRKPVPNLDNEHEQWMAMVKAQKQARLKKMEMRV